MPEKKLVVFSHWDLVLKCCLFSLKEPGEGAVVLHPNPAKPASHWVILPLPTLVYKNSAFWGLPDWFLTSWSAVVEMFTTGSLLSICCMDRVIQGPTWAQRNTLRWWFWQHYYIAHKMHVVLVFRSPNMQTGSGCKGNLDSGEIEGWRSCIVG